jgi:alcohol dehydrogenase class IV
MNRILRGRDALAALAAEYGGRGVERVLVIGGTSSYEQSGAAAVVLSILEGDFIVQQNTASSRLLTPADIEPCVELIAEFRPELVVAVGGGQTIDRAKIAIHAYARNCSIEDLIQDADAGPVRSPVPMLAIPTTTGSGSESTHFAVLYVDRKKISIAHEDMLPDAVVLCPEFTMSMPSDVATASGLDALTQSIESTWSVGATVESRELARQALGLIMENLEVSIHSPTPESRGAMQEAANLAGGAINISKTTACHAMSYPLTAHYGVRHGTAVYMTLPQVMAYNHAVTDDDCLHPGGPEHVRDNIEQLARQFGCESVPDAVDFLASLGDRIGVPRRLRDHGICTDEVVDLVVRDVDPNRVSNNPRRVTEVAIREILEEVI